jgi:hypothetical protein
MKYLFALLAPLAIAQSTMNILFDDDTGRDGIFAAGSTLVPNNFNSTMNFQFTTDGKFVIGFKNTDQILTIGITNINARCQKSVHA